MKTRQVKKHIEKNTSGYSILEIIVAMSIFLIAITIVSGFIRRGYESNRFTLELLDAVNFAKKGIDAMAKEIREANYAENGDYPLVEAKDQSIIFYSDVDSDTSVERIRYYINGTDLMKGVIEPTTSQPIQYPSASENITVITQYIRNGASPIFYYYNGDYPADTANNPLTTPANVNNIKLVRLFLKINIDPIKAPGDFNLEIFSQLRNLKNNL